MSTDLTTLRRLVRQRMGVPTSDDFFTDTVLTDTINQALFTVDAEQRWPWMEQVDTVPLAATLTSRVVFVCVSRTKMSRLLLLSIAPATRSEARPSKATYRPSGESSGMNPRKKVVLAAAS